jgi:hypothetical protein
MPNVQLGFNGTIRLIPIAAGAWTPILTTKASVRAIILQESITTAAGAANTSVGFEVKVANDGTASPGFNTIFSRPAASLTQAPGNFPQFLYYNQISEHGPDGEVIAPYDGATAILLVQPLTNAATVLEVWEFC